MVFVRTQKTAVVMNSGLCGNDGDYPDLGPRAAAVSRLMTESQILTLNERVKGFSNLFFNLAAGLAAATAARIWVDGVDLAALLWVAGVTVLLSLASALLYLLEPEIRDTP